MEKGESEKKENTEGYFIFYFYMTLLVRIAYMRVIAGIQQFSGNNRIDMRLDKAWTVNVRTTKIGAANWIGSSAWIGTPALSMKNSFSNPCSD